MKKTRWLLGVLIVSTAYSVRAQQNPVDTSPLQWVPPHLRGATCFWAPTGLVAFAVSNGASHVMFVDDRQKCGRSIRQQRDIFVNCRATYWDANILPPWLCLSPAEAILQRTLHEIGHVTLGNAGNPDMKSTPDGLVLPKSSDPWDSLRGTEKPAWEFVFRVRDAKDGVYAALLKDVQTWYLAHEYKDKDWCDDAQKQWTSKNKLPFPKSLWTVVPEWVRDEFLNSTDKTTKPNPVPDTAGKLVVPQH